MAQRVWQRTAGLFRKEQIASRSDADREEAMTTEYIRRRDSDRVEHYVDRQNEPQSCALASVGMMWDISRQQCGATDETGYKYISALFPGSLLYSQLLAALSGGNPQGTGTQDPNIASTMRSVGLTITQTDTFNSNTTAQTFGFSWRKARIQDQKPALLGVSWYKRTATGMQALGGHAVVAARCTRRGYVVILDPWDAGLYELHGLHGSYLPSYARNGQIGRIDLVIYTG
jgi:hypothetical protein